LRDFDTRREFVERYHDVLSPDVAADTAEQLDQQLRSRNLVFGGRALCTVLRPRLMPVEELRNMQRQIAPLMRAFRKAFERARVDAAFRAQFRLEDWEEMLFLEDHGLAEPSPTSRLDFFSSAMGAMALTEYNAETPAGAAYNDALADAFLDLPAMRALATRYDVAPLVARHGVMGALLEAWRAWSGARNRPRIAILDWDDVPTVAEFELYQSHFRALGIDCVIDDPRRTEYRDGALIVRDAPAQLIYKRVLITELVQTCGLESPVVRAVRDRAVCMVDGFQCKLLHKKAGLAVLSDERNAAMFDGNDQAAIDASIPWTRVVEERTTTHAGREIDLLPFIAEHRDRLVLKPSDEYGGTGVVLGWTVDASAWERAIRDALNVPSIVQEKVHIPSEPYPSWVDGRVEVYDRMFDTAPFITNGNYMEGLLTRLSTAALLNVTAGGGSTVPTFLVMPR
jgi:hypothetical protein